MNNTKLLEAVDNVSNVVLESDFSVMDALFTSYDKMCTVLENYNGSDVAEFSIFQEAEEAKEAKENAVKQDAPAQSTDANAKDESVIKKILLAPFRLIVKIFDWIKEKLSKTVQPKAEEVAGAISEKTSNILKKVGEADENWLKANWGKLALGGTGLLTAVAGFLTWKKFHGFKKHCEQFIKGIKAFFIGMSTKMEKGEVIKITDNKLLTKLKINEFVTMFSNLKDKLVNTTKLAIDIAKSDNPEEVLKYISKHADDLTDVSKDTEWMSDDPNIVVNEEFAQKLIDSFNKNISKSQFRLDVESIIKKVGQFGEKINKEIVGQKVKIINNATVAYGATADFITHIPNKIKEFWDHIKNINNAAGESTDDSSNNTTNENETSGSFAVSQNGEVNNFDDLPKDIQELLKNPFNGDVKAGGEGSFKYNGKEYKFKTGTDENGNWDRKVTIFGDPIEETSPTEQSDEQTNTASTDKPELETGVDLNSTNGRFPEGIPVEVRELISGGFDTATGKPKDLKSVGYEFEYNNKKYKIAGLATDADGNLLTIKFEEIPTATTESYIDDTASRTRSHWYN